MENRLKITNWRETIRETDNDYDEPEIITVVECFEVLD
jgi:hypothetical protein